MTDKPKEGAIFKKPVTIPASEIGVTLKVSDEALREIERFREEQFKEGLKVRHMAWR